MWQQLQGFFNSPKAQTARQTLQTSMYYATAQAAERDILALSGFQVGNEIQLRDLNDPNDKNEFFLHTYTVQKQHSKDEGSATPFVASKKRKIVLVHGYLSCGATFYKLFAPLLRTFDIYSLDLPGMGLSARPQFTLQDRKEIVQFFTRSIEVLDEQYKLGQFTLVGHSFGGFVAAHYALKNPHKIEKLILISPLGMTQRSQLDIEQWEQTLRGDSSMGSLSYRIHQFLKALFNNGHTLATLHHVSLVPTSFFLNNWMNYWFPNSEREKWLWYTYLKNILSLPVSSDIALNRLFRIERLTAHEPLEAILPSNVKFPIHFVYGDRDWMCKIGTQRLIEQKSLLVPHTYNIVKNAGHNIMYDNPMELAQLLIGL